MNESKRHGTRIFKKSTPNGKVTVYLGKRDFIDHLTHVDPIEGVVLVDPEYVKGRKVYIHLLCAFRHGRDGDEFHGINWHRDLFLNTKQIYPSLALPDENAHSRISRLQERLVRKLGPDSYPFTFKILISKHACILHSSSSIQMNEITIDGIELLAFVGAGLAAAVPLGSYFSRGMFVVTGSTCSSTDRFVDLFPSAAIDMKNTPVHSVRWRNDIFPSVIRTGWTYDSDNLAR
ncbi:hypothetical protein Aperf_G00000092663 [Anoplocephala perfoliata]